MIKYFYLVFTQTLIVPQVATHLFDGFDLSVIDVQSCYAEPPSPRHQTSLCHSSTAGRTLKADKHARAPD
jgi:hypothetical protein